VSRELPGQPGLQVCRVSQVSPELQDLQEVLGQRGLLGSKVNQESRGLQEVRGQPVNQDSRELPGRQVLPERQGQTAVMLKSQKPMSSAHWNLHLNQRATTPPFWEARFQPINCHRMSMM
jgi:hypothetical protein